MTESEDNLVGYAPVPIPAWVRERASYLRQYMFDLGVRAAPADGSTYSIDKAILLLAGELLLPQMTLEIAPTIPDDELVLVHFETIMGPKPALSQSRLVRALGNNRPDGILSVRQDLPWILTSAKGASIAAKMGYVTVPIADLMLVVGALPASAKNS
jgi:hypothetical protein